MKIENIKNEIKSLREFAKLCSIEAQKSIGNSDYTLWENRRDNAEKKITKLYQLLRA